MHRSNSCAFKFLFRFDCNYKALKIIYRIFGTAIYDYFKVQMRTSPITGITGAAELLPSGYCVANFYVKAG